MDEEYEDDWYHITYRGRAIRLRKGQAQEKDHQEGIWYSITPNAEILALYKDATMNNLTQKVADAIHGQAELIPLESPNWSDGYKALVREQAQAAIRAVMQSEEMLKLKEAIDSGVNCCHCPHSVEALSIMEELGRE